jgi:hypothetical protein
VNQRRTLIHVNSLLSSKSLFINSFEREKEREILWRRSVVIGTRQRGMPGIDWFLADPLDDPGVKKERCPL